MIRAWLVLMVLLCCPQVGARAGESEGDGVVGIGTVVKLTRLPGLLLQAIWAEETNKLERPEGANASAVTLPTAQAVTEQQPEGNAGSSASADGQSTGPAAPVNSDTHGFYNAISIKHLWTFEHPLKEAYVTGFQEPDKVFLLELINGWGAGCDIILETNVGIGVMRDELGSSTAMTYRYVEVPCYKRAGDDCSPQAIVVYKASTSYRLNRGPRSEAIRENILHRLEERASPEVLFSDKKEVLFPMPAATSSPKTGATSRRNVHIAYEDSWRYGDIVQITFPPGQGKEYSAIRLFTSSGYAGEKSDQLPVDPRMPDTFRVMIARSDYWPEWHPNHSSPIPLPDKGFGSQRGEGPRVIIYEAKALRRGRWENILPRLVNDPIVRLPVHTLDGPLPSDY